MEPYAIVTDSSCDISKELLASWEVSAVNLTFRVEGEKCGCEEINTDMAAFYKRMKEGALMHTSAVNVGDFTEAFEKELEENRDILYIGFSSGLSTTVNAARIAAKDLKEKFPERTITVIDSLSASAGQGMLVRLAVEERDKGISLERCAAYITEQIPHQCHWFTVDDLKYLRRGGRISPMTAVAGTLLGIKPVMHMDEEGHLTCVGKVRGRKQAISALAEKCASLIGRDSPIFISHADAKEDAELLCARVKELTGKNTDLITDIGAVIGAHAGPGTLALFFIGSKR